MSILGFFANFWFALLFFLAMAACACWFAYKSYKMVSDREGVVGLIASVICTIALYNAWMFSATNTVVPINTAMVVVDGTTGQINGEVHYAGLTSFPLLGSQLNFFPAASNAEKCDTFTPSVKGGYEVSTLICFYFNGNDVDWTSQIRRYNRSSWDALWPAWANQMAPKIAVSIKGYPPQDLTDKRDEASDAIQVVVKGFFKTEGVPLNSVSLRNWDFTNPEVKAAFAKTVIAQTQSAQAQAALDAAEIERRRQLYVADTEVQAAQKKVDAMNKLGIHSEDGVLRWLTLQWLLNPESKTTSTTVIVNTGTGDLKPVVPVPGK